MYGEAVGQATNAKLRRKRVLSRRFLTFVLRSSSVMDSFASLKHYFPRNEGLGVGREEFRNLIKCVFSGFWLFHQDLMLCTFNHPQCTISPCSHPLMNRLGPYNSFVCTQER
ncbi:MAG: hypothetical protein ACI9PU_001367, partial [Ascidiaceihabitans sp.]